MRSIIKTRSNCRSSFEMCLCRRTYCLVKHVFFMKWKLMCIFKEEENAFFLFLLEIWDWNVLSQSSEMIQPVYLQILNASYYKKPDVATIAFFFLFKSKNGYTAIQSGVHSNSSDSHFTHFKLELDGNVYVFQNLEYSGVNTDSHKSQKVVIDRRGLNFDWVN